jgi:hypothetical protein
LRHRVYLYFHGAHDLTKTLLSIQWMILTLLSFAAPEWACGVEGGHRRDLSLLRCVASGNRPSYKLPLHSRVLSMLYSIRLRRLVVPGALLGGPRALGPKTPQASFLHLSCCDLAAGTCIKARRKAVELQYDCSSFQWSPMRMDSQLIHS